MTRTVPPELIDQIYSYALPAPSRTSGQERAQLLGSLSLLNTQWTTPARGQLNQHVTLSTEKQAAKLLQVFKQGTFDPLEVKTLVLNVPLLSPKYPVEEKKKGWKNLFKKGKEDTSVKIPKDVVLEVVRRMVRVQTVWSSKIMDGEEDLARLLGCFDKLKSLRLIHNEPYTNFFALVPGYYTSISTLSSLTFSSTSSNFLSLVHTPGVTSHTFSNITHLALSHVPEQNFDLLAPQLLSFAIALKDPIGIGGQLQNCTKLKTLLIDSTYPIPSVTDLLCSLPPSLKALHVVGTFIRVEEHRLLMRGEFTKSWESISWGGRLEKFVMWPRLKERLEESPEHVALFKELWNVKGVELVVVPPWRGEVEVEDWDPNEY